MLLLAVPGGVIAQEPDMQYDRIRAVVDGLRAPHEAVAVEHHLRGKADVRVCRVDFNTRNLMVQVPRASQLSQALFSSWCEELGYQLRCYHRDHEDGSHLPLLNNRTCGVAPTER